MAKEFYTKGEIIDFLEKLLSANRNGVTSNLRTEEVMEEHNLYCKPLTKFRLSVRYYNIEFNLQGVWIPNIRHYRFNLI